MTTSLHGTPPSNLTHAQNHQGTRGSYNLLLRPHQRPFGDQTVGFWFNRCNWNTAIMPSSTKTLFFILSASMTALAVGFLGWGMSTWWFQTTMECTSGGSEFFNGTAIITLRLFGGNLRKSFCPSFGPADIDFEGNFPRLWKGKSCQNYKTLWNKKTSEISCL